MKFKSSRLVVAAVGVTAFGAASAASLGGLTSTGVGSNDVVVASCDTDGVAIAYGTAYSATASKYQVTTVTISGIATGCSGQTLAVTVKGTGGTSLASASKTVAGASETLTLSAPAAAESLTGASVVISS